VNKRGTFQRDLLGDHSTEGVAEDIQTFQAKCIDDARACAAMPDMFSGTWPVERPRPALSKRMTSRPTASGSVTEGSQLSKVPVKCWRHNSGRPLPFPKRR